VDDEDAPAELADRIIGADRPSTTAEKRLRLQWNVPSGVTPYIPLWFVGVFVLLVIYVVVVSWPQDRTCAKELGGLDHPQAPAYLGLSESDASSKALTDGVPFRVMCRDGEPQSGTADLQRDRVNVGIDEGRVTIAQRY